MLCETSETKQEFEFQKISMRKTQITELKTIDEIVYDKEQTK